MLEETRIIDCDDGIITRTAIPLPSQTAQAILEDLMKHHADNEASHQLTYNVGSRMADVLSGKADGPQLIFGDAKNRELVASLYGELPFKKLYFYQTTLKILEMGAGTGGTTKVIYTFTDRSPSLVAQAKRKFKQYPFMKFAVHDIEKAPAEQELIGSQHTVIASNAVHATHSLQGSNGNIRKFLRPDGFLILLEMMGSLHWVDVVWGTLEGWWLFDDGRSHAIVYERRWEKELLASGFKHVEWTDGKLPEVHVQQVLIAMAADVPQALDNPPAADLSEMMGHGDGEEESEDDLQARKAAADKYVESTIQGFSVPPQTKWATVTDTTSSPVCVLVTGATGSLGSHIVAHLASLPTVDKVYCLNHHRPSGQVRVPEEPLDIDRALPNGYGGAKVVYERVLRETPRPPSRPLPRHDGPARTGVRVRQDRVLEPHGGSPGSSSSWRRRYWPFRPSRACCPGCRSSWPRGRWQILSYTTGRTATLCTTWTNPITRD
ncbi:hypothetical protein PG994_007991 [Apiospora phragmitis]|uniref:Methyltransferase type 12 domain-containing protein n=1 Tax=Apiospora phragmitis TaxID=2905665 RepID=A0ABR1UUB9_9PEZI